MGHKVQGTLLIIGGAEDKDGECEVLQKFVSLAGRDSSVIVVITTATQQPESMGREYSRVFRRLGAGAVDVLDIDSRTKANHAYTAKILEKATGIFFTGGDQLRITSTLGGTITNEVIRNAYLQGAVIAGTSAGASVMSDIMIVEGDSEEAPKLNTIKMAPGLGLLEESVIDQHFAQRGRIGRLLSAVAHNPYILGIGIDEDTGILVGPDARMEVVGSQTVTIIDGRNMGFTNVSELSPGQALAIQQVILHILPRGFGFDLTTRTPFKTDAKKGEEDENHRDQPH